MAAADAWSRARLASWLDRLQADGFHIGLRERLLAPLLMVRVAALGGLPTSARARLALLRPLLCTSPAEQQRYGELLQDEDAAWQAQVLSMGGRRRGRSEGLAEDAEGDGDPASGAMPGAPARAAGGFRRLIGLALLVAAVLAAGLFLFKRPPGDRPDGAAAPASAASAPAAAVTPASGGLQIDRPDPAASSAGSSSNLSAGGPRALPIYVPPRAMLIEAPPPTSAWLTALRWALGSLGLLALAWWGWRVWQLKRRRSFLAHVHDDELVDERVLRDEQPAQVAPPAGLVAQVTRSLRQRVAGEARVLDVGATIRATIRRGGALLPQYRLLQRTPEYLALVERVGPADQQAHLHESLIAALQARGVVVEVFHYRHSPQQGCWRLRGQPGRVQEADRERHDHSSWAELLARFPQHRLLMFGDARAALHPDTGQPLPWLAGTKQFPQRAWFTPLPVANWSTAEALVADDAGLDFLLLPLEPAAFVTLAEWLGSGRAELEQHPQSPLLYPPMLHGEESAWALRRVPPPAQACDQLLFELRHYLGPERMQWLAACAIFPGLSWPLTLVLGRRLFEHLDGVTSLSPQRQGDLAIGVAALAALPWFRHGRLPDWLRELLMQQLQPANEALLRQVIGQRLQDAIPAPAAATSGGEEIARIAWQRQASQRLLAWLQGRRGASRDLILVRFLQPQLASRLMVRLPQALQRLLFRDGVLLRGLRGWVHAVMALPLLGGLVALTPLWHQIQPPVDDAARPQRVVIDSASGADHVTALAISPDGLRLALGRATGQLELREARQGRQLLASWPAHAASPTALAWSADGLTLFSGDAQGAVAAWSGRTGAVVRPVGPLVPVGEAAGAGLVGAKGGSGKVGKKAGRDPGASATTSSPLPAIGTSPVSTRPGAITALAVSPRGEVLATAGVGGVWLGPALGTGPLTRLLQTDEVIPSLLTFNAAGSLLAVGLSDGQVAAWSIRPDGQLDQGMGSVAHKAASTALAFDVDDQSVLSLDVQGGLHRWTPGLPSQLALRPVDLAGPQLGGQIDVAAGSWWTVTPGLQALTRGALDPTARGAEQRWSWADPAFPASAAADVHLYPGGAQVLARAGVGPMELAQFGRDDATSVAVLGCSSLTADGSVDESAVDLGARSLANRLAAVRRGAVGPGSAGASGAPVSSGRASGAVDGRAASSDPAYAPVAYAAAFRRHWGLLPIRPRALEVLYRQSAVVAGAGSAAGTAASASASAPAATSTQPRPPGRPEAEALVAWLQQQQAPDDAVDLQWRARAVFVDLPAGLVVSMCDASTPARPRYTARAWPGLGPDATRAAALATRLAALSAADPARRQAALAQAREEVEFIPDLLPGLLDRTTRQLRAASAGNSAAATATATATGAAFTDPASLVPTTLQLLAEASPVTLQRLAPALSDLFDLLDPQAAAVPDAATFRAYQQQRQALQAALEGKQVAATAPLVYLHIASEAQRPLANQIQARLRAAGLAAPGVQLMGPARSPERTELRVQGRSDQALARWLATQLTVAAPAPLSLQVDRLWTLKQAQPTVDTYELWLGKTAGAADVVDTTLKPGDRFRDCPVETLCPWLRVLPAGSFLMGSPKGEQGLYDDESPQHKVTIAQGFALMEAEVTRGQFARFVQETGHKAEGGCIVLKGGNGELDARRSWRDPGFAQTDSHPVVCVNWNDAAAFAKWLSGKTGRAYALPNEAQWEYAARAGTTTRWSFGDNEADLCSHANVQDTTAKRDVKEAHPSWTFATCDDRAAFTAPGKTYKPNAWGLYDMHGNAREWVADCWHQNYQSAPTDGSEWLSGCSSDVRRVQRGGGSGSIPQSTRSAMRYDIAPERRNYGAGFRLARTLLGPEAAGLFAPTSQGTK